MKKNKNKLSTEEKHMKNSSYYIELENQYGAHIYDPIPVVIDKGQGVYV